MSKTAVITGATSGIGAAYARRLAKDGYDLIITGRKKETIQKLADDISKQYKIKVDVIIAELSNDNDFQKLANTVKANNAIEILINNAGYSGYARHFEEVDITEHEKMVKVHQIVPLRLISFILPGMIKRGKGNIINVCSVAAILSTPSNTVYSGTKAFLKSYSQGLYQEVRDKGIRVQALCPGFTNTNFAKDYYAKELYDNVMKSTEKTIMAPEKVVDYSLKCLKKDQFVCIPGLRNRMMAMFLPPIPMGMYTNMAKKMTPFK
jgi:short-subunit dehydrogenase